jgi:hypothetical protein
VIPGGLVTTYGKTFHTWQYDRDDFPYGIPQLMMGLTQDGQANEALIHDRDHRLGVSTPHKRQSRADIPTPQMYRAPTPGRAAGPTDTPRGDGLQAVASLRYGVKSPGSGDLQEPRRLRPTTAQPVRTARRSVQVQCNQNSSNAGFSPECEGSVRERLSEDEDLDYG